MSIHQLIEISRRSFRSLDAAMNVAGQNVANAETEGYARQRITMGSDHIRTGGSRMASGTGRQPTGAGVSVQTYERMRDDLLLRSRWEAGSAVGYAEEEHRVLGALEGLFPVQGEGTLNARMERFWGAWSDLADHPQDQGVRRSLRSEAQGLASALNHMDRSIRELEQQTRDALTGGVEEVNGLIEEIGALNRRIVDARRSGSPDLSAEDMRDQHLNRLADFVPLRIQNGADGNMTISAGGMPIVDGVTVKPLELDTSGSTPEIRFGGTARTWQPGAEAGKLGAWMQTLSNALPDTRAALDTLAETLVTRVNAVHGTGTALNGDPGGDFFDPEGVTAATISLSEAVAGDASAIAASSGSPDDGFADSDIANGMLSLRDEVNGDLGNATMEDFVINLVGGLGAEVNRAGSAYEGHAAFANHLEAMERGVSGVSMEEEMTNLIQLQQAFDASARVLRTAQDMMDTLLAL